MYIIKAKILINKRLTTLSELQKLSFMLLNYSSIEGNKQHNELKESNITHYLNKGQDTIFINISDDKFAKLGIKSFYNNIKTLQSGNISVEIINYSIKYISDNFVNNLNSFQTLTGIYINDYNKDGNAINYNIDLNEGNYNAVKNQILQNINNFCDTKLTFDDVSIIVAKNYRTKTGFNDKHYWNLFYITINFKTNTDETLSVKKNLMTGLYKSSYTGYFSYK